MASSSSGTGASGAVARVRKSGTRRGNGEGTITQRADDGRWMARVVLDGKRHTFYGKTRTEVHTKLAAATADQRSGLPVVGTRLTVGVFLMRWLDGEQQNVRASTFKRKTEYVKVHLIPALGNVPLAKLTPQQVRDLYTAKRAAGLSTSTLNHLHHELKAALTMAVRDGLAARNVATYVDPPRMERHEMQVLTPEQARRFMAATAQDPDHGALWLLAITTGMREGELLALRWDDVDLDRADGATLRVVANLAAQGGGRYARDETKTASSRRTIRLRPEVVEALRAHRARQNAQRLSLGGGWDDHGLVFPNCLGRPLDPMNLYKYFYKPFLVQAGLPSIRFHDLRHTAATLLLSQNVPVKVVSEMLGHSDVATTLRVYGHVLPDMQRQALTAWDGLFAVTAQ